MRRRRRRRTGFTLIELVLTIVVISVGLLGVLALFENAVRGAALADINVIAAHLAREKLEQIVHDKVRFGYAALDETLYPAESFSGDFSSYARSTTIDEVSNADFLTPEVASGYKRVEVTVSWGAAANMHITIPTVLADY